MLFCYIYFILSRSSKSIPTYAEERRLTLNLWIPQKSIFNLKLPGQLNETKNKFFQNKSAKIKKISGVRNTMASQGDGTGTLQSLFIRLDLNVKVYLAVFSGIFDFLRSYTKHVNPKLWARLRVTKVNAFFLWEVMCVCFPYFWLGSLG